MRSGTASLVALIYCLLFEDLQHVQTIWDDTRSSETLLCDRVPPKIVCTCCRTPNSTMKLTIELTLPFFLCISCQSVYFIARCILSHVMQNIVLKHTLRSYFRQTENETEDLMGLRREGDEGGGG